MANIKKVFVQDFHTTFLLGQLTRSWIRKQHWDHSPGRTKICDKRVDSSGVFAGLRNALRCRARGNFVFNTGRRSDTTQNSRPRKRELTSRNSSAAVATIEPGGGASPGLHGELHALGVCARQRDLSIEDHRGGACCARMAADDTGRGWHTRDGAVSFNFCTACQRMLTHAKSCSAHGLAHRSVRSAPAQRVGVGPRSSMLRPRPTRPSSHAECSSALARQRPSASPSQGRHCRFE